MSREGRWRRWDRRSGACLGVVVAYRVAVAMWQCVGWTGLDLGIILSGGKSEIGAVLAGCRGGVREHVKGRALEALGSPLRWVAVADRVAVAGWQCVG
jgi:hypothetical protein